MASCAGGPTLASALETLRFWSVAERRTSACSRSPTKATSRASCRSTRARGQVGALRIGEAAAKHRRAPRGAADDGRPRCPERLHVEGRPRLERRLRLRVPVGEPPERGDRVRRPVLIEPRHVALALGRLDRARSAGGQEYEKREGADAHDAAGYTLCLPSCASTTRRRRGRGGEHRASHRGPALFAGTEPT